MTTISSSLASSWASSLFSKLDTSNQGYLSKSDLESAFSSISDSSSSTSSADDVFSSLDSDSDGKVTKDEFTTALENLASQLNGQYDSSRMQGGPGDMPPPPPDGANGNGPPPPPPDGAQGANDGGFTKDQLQAQLDEIGSTDSKRSSLISKIVENFDKADANGDGKVDMQEAMAYDKSTSSSSTSSTTTTSSSSDSSSSDSDSASSSADAKVLAQIMQLMQAYGVFGQDNNNSSFSSLLSTSA